jgi:integrase
MARVVLPKMTPTAEGGFSARKRIPEDVQDAYQELYGKKHEERFNSGPVPVGLAREKLTAWFNEMEARIKNIRAERKGEGRTLTPMEARSLSGKWYLWWTARHLSKPRDHVSLDIVFDQLIDAALDGVRDVYIAQTGDHYNDVPKDYFDAVFERDFEARKPARAFAADCGETSQFLLSENLTLDPASRELFLDYVCKDMFEAFRLLIKRAKGDYSEDTHPGKFPPKFERKTDHGLTPWVLFERWVKQMKPARSTVDRWRAVFLKLKEDFPNHSAAMFTPEEIKPWLDGLVTEERTARTVNDVWRVAGRSVFGWAVDQKLISRNPFADVKVPVPRKRTNRETKAFTETETKTILTAASAISKPRTKGEAVRRWVPWLCAYTGARSGEITQLRGSDVEQKGVHAIRITPEAGSVKAGKPRTVPLHEHLIEQGFLDFVNRNGRGPLFYNEPKGSSRDAEEITNPKRPPAVTARVHLAEWVRNRLKSLGIDDPEVKPNHAWRETFKQIGHRHEISERILDAIAGHAPISVGRGYGLPTLGDMAAALKKFPRYEID